MKNKADINMDKLTIYPCSNKQTKDFLLIIVGAPLTIWGLTLVIKDASNVFALIGWIVLSIMICFGLIILISNAFLNLPQLELNTEGIRFKHSIFKTQFYQWVDVGKFSIDHHVVKSKYSTTTFIYACAYNDLAHDALFFNGKPASASMHDANILIPINELDGGTCLTKAVSITKTLNEWRKKHGAPENNALQLSSEEVEALEADYTKKRQSGAFWMFAVGVFVVIINILVAILDN